MAKVTDIAQSTSVIAQAIRRYEAILLAADALGPELHETLDTAFETMAAAAISHARTIEAVTPTEALPVKAKPKG